MTPKPEQANWEWAARELAAASQAAPSRGRLPKARAAGGWRIISADGSARSARQTQPSPSVPRATAEPADARPTVAPAASEPAVEAPIHRAPVEDEEIPSVNMTGLLAPVVVRGALFPERSAHRASDAGFRPNIAMPSAAPSLDDPPGSQPPPDPADLEEGASPAPGRQPGVDGRRSTARLPIDLPKQQMRPCIPPNAVTTALSAKQALGSVAMSRGRLDPQLSRVMDAWPSLSMRTRDAILAMIDVALGKR